MTPEQGSLVRSTWAAIEPHVDDVIVRFYAYVFRCEPGVRQMFAPVDMGAQRRKVLDMIGALVRAVDDPVGIVTATIPAARRHAAYHVSERHVSAGRDALLHALECTLGERFTPQARQAWRELYSLVAAVMKRAASRHAPGGISCRCRT